jgi:hypothetical protein
MLLEKTSYTRRYTWVDNLSLFYWKLKKNISSTFLLVVTRWSSCQSLAVVVVNNKCQPVAACLAKYCATNPLSWDEIHGPTNVDTSSFEGGANCCQNDVEIFTLSQRFANVDLLEATNHSVVPPTSAHRQRRVLHPALIRFLHFNLFQFHPHWIRHQHLYSITIDFHSIQTIWNVFVFF